jgi:hypothetical protein
MLMRSISSLVALSLASLAVPALAMDEVTASMIADHKPGKVLSAELVGRLMGASEIWCYNQEGTTCEWTDIYLAVDSEEAEVEISYVSNLGYELTYVDHGVFEEGKLCAGDYDFVPSLRAKSLETGEMFKGRPLAVLRDELAYMWESHDRTCFDYVYVGRDEAADTVKLTQRQYGADGEVQQLEANVTLHFDPKTASALTLQR